MASSGDDPIDAITDTEQQAIVAYVAAMEALKRVKDERATLDARRRCREEKKTQVELLEATLDALQRTCLSVPLDDGEVFVRKQTSTSSKPVTAAALEGALRALSMADLNEEHAKLSSTATDAVPMVDVIEAALLAKLKTMLTTRSCSVTVSDKPERGFQGNGIDIDDAFVEQVRTYLECTTEAKNLSAEQKEKQAEHEAKVAEHRDTVADLIGRVRPDSNIVNLNVVGGAPDPLSDEEHAPSVEADMQSRPMYLKRKITKSRPKITIASLKKNGLLKSAAPDGFVDQPFSVAGYTSIANGRDFVAQFVSAFNVAAESWSASKEKTVTEAELLRGRKKRKVGGDGDDEEE